MMSAPPYLPPREVTRPKKPQRILVDKPARLYGF